MSANNGRSVRARHAARDMLVQALYQWQIAGATEAELTEQFAAAPEYGRIDRAYFLALLHAAISNAADLEAVIAARAHRDVAQLDPIGRAVLLIALSELDLRPDVPTKVIINEAVELAKRYGPAEAYRFVNAVLDKVAAATPGRQIG